VKSFYSEISIVVSPCDARGVDVCLPADIFPVVMLAFVWLNTEISNRRGAAM
jgi:hypothetical protein